ncbi:MAG: hypothetical protein JWP47_398 [Polaromonas sp.]|nr:hypothetical protein [Polaromonas sp.]
MTHMPSQLVPAFLGRLASEPAVLVTIGSTHGSAPRDAGTWMAVFAGAIIGTIGGGHLEYRAIAEARKLLASSPDRQAVGSIQTANHLRLALGPALGQCCGGVVHLSLARVIARDVVRLGQELSMARQVHPVALFGGGHVGHALVGVLSQLPFVLTWIDSRDEVFPPYTGPNLGCEHSDPVEAAVPGLVPGSRVLIMSFSHAEDLDVLAACLMRQRESGDLPYIGLIGSKTKWAVFRSRLEARGFTPDELAHVTCPIGVRGIAGKEPEVIAVAVAAQLLQSLGNTRPLA